MNKRIIVCLLITVSTLVTGCQNKTTGITKKAEPLVVNTPNECNLGSITIKDADGNTYFNYIGAIDIQNDGKDGRVIKIKATIPSEEGW